MNNVIIEKVKKIIKITVQDIELFIDMSDMIVKEQLMNKGLSDKRLENILIYLTAHFIASNEDKLKSEKIGDVENVYHVLTEDNLSSTSYGNIAILLDTSGTLKNLGKTKSEFRLL